MFSKRTIKQKVTVQSVDTASEAYALSLAEKARIDMPYMSKLTGKTEQELFEDLKGVIFLNPMHISEEDSKPKYLLPMNISPAMSVKSSVGQSGVRSSTPRITERMSVLLRRYSRLT